MDDQTTTTPDMPETHTPETGARKTGSPQTIAEAVDLWFAESFAGSVVARSTETWNHVHAAAQALKHRLAAAFGDMRL